MKKIISALAALTACAVMLSACGGNSGSDLTDEIETSASVSEETKAAEAEETTGETTEASETSETAEEVTGADEEQVSAENAASFASLDEFAASDIEELAFAPVEVKESNIYDFTMTFVGATSMYIDAASTDGSMAMTMAADANNKIAMDVTDTDGSRAVIIIKDMKMYMLDPSTSTGMYTSVDESIFEEYDLKAAFEEMASIDEDDITDSEVIMCCPVSINGTTYTVEAMDEGCMLFNGDGSLYAIVSDGSTDINVLLINSLTSEVPSNAFDVPEGYELTDLDAAMAAQQ